MGVAVSYSGTPVDGWGTAETSRDLTTLTVTAGSNLILIAFITTNNTASSFSATWDQGASNQAMTSVGTTNLAGCRVQMFYLIAPVSGNKTLRIAWTTGSSGIIAAAAFSGADQTNGINAPDTVIATGTSTTPSQAVTSDADGATVAMVGAPDSYIASTTGSQTEIYRTATGGYGNGAGYILGGASNTHSWSDETSLNYSFVGAHILAAAAGGHPAIRRFGQTTRGGIWGRPSGRVFSFATPRLVKPTLQQILEFA